jgi:hypothetical protein
MMVGSGRRVNPSAVLVFNLNEQPTGAQQRRSAYENIVQTLFDFAEPSLNAADCFDKFFFRSLPASAADIPQHFAQNVECPADIANAFQNQLFVFAVDHAAHCTKAVSQFLQAFLYVMDPVDDVDLRFIIPVAAKIFQGLTKFFKPLTDAKLSVQYILNAF